MLVLGLIPPFQLDLFSETVDAVPLFHDDEEREWICGTNDGTFLHVPDDLIADSHADILRPSAWRILPARETTETFRVPIMQPDGLTSMVYEDIEIRKARNARWSWRCGHGPRTKAWIVAGSPRRITDIA